MKNAETVPLHRSGITPAKLVNDCIKPILARRDFIGIPVFFEHCRYIASTHETAQITFKRLDRSAF